MRIWEHDTNFQEEFRKTGYLKTLLLEFKLGTTLVEYRSCKGTKGGVAQESGIMNVW